MMGKITFDGWSVQVKDGVLQQLVVNGDYDAHVIAYSINAAATRDPKGNLYRNTLFGGQVSCANGGTVDLQPGEVAVAAKSNLAALLEAHPEIREVLEMEKVKISLEGNAPMAVQDLPEGEAVPPVTDYCDGKQSTPHTAMK